MLLEREFLLEIAGVDALEPFDLDFLDVELLAFLHVEDQHGGGAVGRSPSWSSWPPECLLF